MSFLKPFSIKSNSKIKSSERKQLLDRFCEHYNLATPPDELSSNDVCCIKIKLADSETILVYTFSSRPMLILRGDTLIPTIYLLWIQPNILPHFVTHDNVVPRLTSGADLMLPGVIRDQRGLPWKMDPFSKNTLCAISTAANRAAVAIGYTALSSEDMLMSRGKGKAVLVYHVVGDKLCSLTLPLSRPIIVDECQNLGENVICEETDLNENADEKKNVQSELNADQLLCDCFLRGLQIVEDKQLPMPVNVFYSQYMLSLCREAPLDIRKTKYKKVGVFLRAMEQNSYIQLDEPKSGVLLVKSINRDHQVFSNLPSSDIPTPAGKSWPPGYCGPPVVEEVYSFTGPISALFDRLGVGRNSHLSQSAISKLLDQYIRDSNIRFPSEGESLLYVDQVMSKFCPPRLFVDAPESTLSSPVLLITYRDFVRSVYDRLQKSYRIISPAAPDSPTFFTGKNPPSIELKLAKRSGKDVTRVANVHIFGIDPDSFSKHLQTHLACSVARVDEQAHMGSTCVLQAQGSHVVSLSKLLTESYGIPKKFIKGYEEEPKKKKK